MSWLNATMTAHTWQWLGLVAWATTGSWLAVDQAWRCHRWHCGITTTDQLIAWDQPPATADEPAEAGHHTMRETG